MLNILLNNFKSHGIWVSSVLLIVWGVSGVFLGKESFNQAVIDVLGGLAGLGVHLNLKG